jgi:hypothetical protein
MKRAITLLALALAISCPARAATACQATSATGATCSAECPDGMHAICYSGATEARCFCRDQPGDPNRKWGPVGANGPTEISALQGFYDYLTGTLGTAGALLIAGDVSAAISAIQSLSQGSYETANTSYSIHWENLGQSDRDAMLGWISGHTTLH